MGEVEMNQRRAGAGTAYGGSGGSGGSSGSRREREPSGGAFRQCEEADEEDSSTGGMGWIIKNPVGEVSCRGSSTRTHISSALMAEVLAMREALKKAKELNLHSLQVFSDSQVLISTLRSRVDMNEIAGVLQDIKILVTLFCSFPFSYIPRSENSQADALARLCLSSLLIVV
ncbi:hypothetical protein Bca101_068624 [Brassica carinata]